MAQSVLASLALVKSSTDRASSRPRLPPAIYPADRPGAGMAWALKYRDHAALW